MDRGNRDGSGGNPECESKVAIPRWKLPGRFVGRCVGVDARATAGRDAGATGSSLHEVAGVGLDDQPHFFSRFELQ